MAKDWNYYNSSELDRVIRELTVKFEDACEIYKTALGSRTSNRSIKELQRGNTRGTAIHRFQCNFAWIIHAMQTDHESFVDSNVRRANGLIEHIGNISDK